MKQKHYTLIGNWKMNPSSQREVDSYVEKYSTISKKQDISQKVSVWIASPCVYIQRLHNTIFPLAFIGAQDVSLKEEGSFSGEVSAQMLYNQGASFSLVGHSERRSYHQETDEDACEKILQLKKQNMKPVLCVGEGWEEREQGKTTEKIERQIKTALQKVKQEDLKDIFIAYEPIWAVGSDRTPTSQEIKDVKTLIQEIIKDMYGKREEIGILYGGSVHSKNTRELIVDSGMDGGLIGRSSLDPKEFLDVALQLQ